MTTPTSRPIRLLIADAQELSRHGLRAVLAADSGIDIVGEAADGRDALHDARVQRPDIVIVVTSTDVVYGGFLRSSPFGVV